MSSDDFIERCNVCGKNFQFGPHQYDGRHIPLYEITVCKSCWDAHRDGWAPHLEDRVTAKLKSKRSVGPPDAYRLSMVTIGTVCWNQATPI